MIKSLNICKKKKDFIALTSCDILIIIEKEEEETVKTIQHFLFLFLEKSTRTIPTHKTSHAYIVELFEGQGSQSVVLVYISSHITSYIEHLF